MYLYNLFESASSKSRYKILETAKTTKLTLRNTVITTMLVRCGRPLW